MPPASDFEPEVVGLEIPITMIRHLDLDKIVPQSRCVFRDSPPNGDAMRRFVRYPWRSSSRERNQSGSRSWSRHRSRSLRRNHGRCRSRSRRWSRQNRSRAVDGQDGWCWGDQRGVLLRRPGRHQYNDQDHHTDDNPKKHRRARRLASPRTGRRGGGRIHSHETILRWEDEMMTLL